MEIIDIFIETFLTGKMGASGAFAIIYVYTAEMYPTVVRGTALGLCSLAGRIGGVIAPLVRIKNRNSFICVVFVLQ